MKTPTAGELNERITIQAATVTLGTDFNEEILTWPADGTGTTVWAKVTPRGSREPILADRPVMVVGYEIVIRSGTTVTNANRVQWRGKNLSVESVVPNAAAGFMMLQCIEADY